MSKRNSKFEVSSDSDSSFEEEAIDVIGDLGSPREKTRQQPKRQKSKGQLAEEEPETDFLSPALKQGEKKIVTWDIEGFSQIMNEGLDDYLKNEDPDIICLQKTQISKTNVQPLEGYHFDFVLGTDEKLGVGILSKVKPKRYFSLETLQPGTNLVAEFEDFFLVSALAPYSGIALQHLDERVSWDETFLKEMKTLDAVKPVVIGGNFNVVCSELDTKYWKANYKNAKAGVTEQERKNFEALVANFSDVYRNTFPSGRAYTYWPRNTSRVNKGGCGWRFEYFLVSKILFQKVQAVYCRPYVTGSKHCPLVVHMTLEITVESKEEQAATVLATTINSNPSKFE